MVPQSCWGGGLARWVGYVKEMGRGGIRSPRDDPLLKSGFFIIWDVWFLLVFDGSGSRRAREEGQGRRIEKKEKYPRGAVGEVVVCVCNSLLIVGGECIVFPLEQALILPCQDGNLRFT